MIEGKNVFKGTDGRYYCAKCKEPVEEFYPKGSVKENKKHHRQCACERERYAKDVRYHKEKEQRERITRNRSICFSEKVMQNWNFENAKKDNLALEIARKYVANWKEMKRRHMGYMFWGPVGTGKSFLAGCIANALLDQGVSVKMTNFNTILNDLFALQEKEEYIQALSKYAEKGRVPNIVYGYDKSIGDYFNLAINKEESKVVKQIYKWYTEEGYGAAKISNMLNEKGYTTKRNCKWSQNAICRILTNEIYTGKIINGKQEISDFLTGQRREKDETEWIVVERPELRIIEDETFELAQEILRGRHDAFNLTHERQSNKHLFSTLIKCKECGWSFRRTVRTYKNTYVRWVCSGRNGRGADSCPNKTVVDEEELIEVLQEYFTNVLKQKKKVIAHVVNEFQRVYKAKDENVEYEKELNAKLAKLQKTRQKYMDMYTDDLISREELNDKIGGMRQEVDRLENELKMVSYHLTKGQQLENILNRTFKEIEDITDVHEMTNQQLKRLIQKIEVDKDGNVDIYLRLLGDLGLDKSVLITEEETVLNSNDGT